MHIKLRISLFLMILFMLITGDMAGQENYLGVPNITNYKSKDYGYESQNYDIAQSDEGLMYFANVSGIIEYDNNNWNILRFYGEPQLDAGCSKKIFVAGSDKMGYLKMTNSGISFSSVKEDEIVGDEKINKVVALCGDVFFAGKQKIYKYSDDELTLFYEHTDNLSIYKAGGQMFAWISGDGFYNFSGDRFVPVNELSGFKDYGIIDMCMFKEKIFFKPKRSKGIHYIENGKTKKFSTEVDNLLEAGNTTKILNYRNKYLIIGTELNGIFIFGNKGQLIFHLNKSSGLADNHISNMFIDKDKQLWVSTYNGISYVELSSPFTFYSSDERLNISILDIDKYNDGLYFSTNQALYRANTEMLYSKEDYNGKNGKIFKKVDKLDARIKNIEVCKNNLYALTNRGTYQVKNTSSEFLFEGETENIIKSQFYQNQYYITGERGLLIGSADQNGRIKIEGKVNKLNYHLRSIVEDKDGNLWIGSDEDGLFRVVFEKSKELNPEVIRYEKDKGLPDNYDWGDVYKTRNGIIFSTYKGVYRFNKKSKTFYADELIGCDFSEGKRWVYPIYEDSKGNLWFSSGVKNKYRKTTAVALYQGKGKAYKLKRDPFQLISDKSIESIYVEDYNTVWFGSLNGIIRYEGKQKREKNSEISSIIRYVSVSKDSVIVNGGVISNKTQTVSHKLYHNENNLRFEFSAPFYQSGNNVVYKTRLLGLQEKWSNWSDENIKEYTSLSPGAYTFQVKAKNSSGEESLISEYSFTIRPPFYLTWWAIIIYLAIILSLIYMIIRKKEYKYTREKYKLENIIAKRTEDLLKQKEQTEKLVNRILPKTTIEEIREKGKASSRRYEMVTVLFADIQDFTSFAKKTKPETLIKRLDKIFKSFDQMIDKYNIEKIKTMGDAYMCAGGIPNENSTNPIEVVLAALEMQRVVENINNSDDVQINLRIGIHTGPVISGVIGTHKIAYDIWGDTVNIANRMETYGEVSQVNISSVTYSYIKNFYHCSYRGKSNIKKSGDIEMYFVRGIHPHLAKDRQRIMPNHDFIIKTQLVRLQDLQNDIFEKLEKNLPENLYYHNVKHTINVYYQTEMIASSENVSDEEMLLLKTAALMHDIGYLVGYDKHEEKGVEMARKTLPSYDYSESQINIICDLILATNFPQKPKNHLEEIICDADLDYLGRPDFMPTSQNLFRELFERNKISTIEQWNKMQMKFMEKHKYFTATARKEREPEKQKRLAELKKML